MSHRTRGPVRAMTRFYPKQRSDHDPAALPKPKGVRKAPADRMNKGEARYAGTLDERQQAGHVAAWWFELISVRLADDTTYRPDFLVLLADGGLEIHEVKGASKGTFAATEVGWAKAKMTAEVTPFPVVVVWPDKAGGWAERRL